MSVHNKYVEDIAEILSVSTRVEDKSFFRLFGAFYLTKLASNMGTKVLTKDRGEVVVNLYGVGLASSGFGKGRSLGIIEENIMGGFTERFTNHLLPTIAEKHITQLATVRSVKGNSSFDEEYHNAIEEYKNCGEYMYTAGEGTPAAIKQYRHKLLLAGIGAVNFVIDEIGSNIEKNADVIELGLELYDQGKVKDKMTKNTAESKRIKQIVGKTPMNLLMFGTPSKLFDDGKSEKAFMDFLDAGYARRSIFAYCQIGTEFDDSITAEEIYKRTVDASIVTKMEWLNDYFGSLAIEELANKTIIMEENENLELIRYQLDCERRASLMSRFDEIERAEMVHRYFRVLKLATAFAFLDQSDVIRLSDISEAIALVEESGIAFNKIMERDKSYMTLAKYIAESRNELTHADLSEKLPFYPKGSGQRSELMMLAKAWGFKEGILIKTNSVEGIEFISGETLMETDVALMRISASRSLNEGYKSFQINFNELHKILCQKDSYWINHNLEGDKALEKECVEGVNLVSFEVNSKDFDSSRFVELFKDYKYLIRETGETSYEVILPLNYTLGLTEEEYKLFIENFLLWLPFKPKVVFQDRLTRKLGYQGNHSYNEGILVDVIPFIPNTAKNDVFKNNINQLTAQSSLERWFANKISIGNKSDVIKEYVNYLADFGEGLAEVSEKAHKFNNATLYPITSVDLDSSIIRELARNKYVKGGV